jgi:hypothetical protein
MSVVGLKEMLESIVAGAVVMVGGAAHSGLEKGLR